ncbi:ABC transporter permease [Nocardia speluncae]|uniref:Transport permease protein n=1 Tax=Nocardia speluncae TaxID=419477 RepID=A0A846XPF1_9NOCA|nr:ABC transporter permease [Nocardia speluncae]NKY36403.1 ABC transporter permease [Nocardia speluncae]
MSGSSPGDAGKRRRTVPSTTSRTDTAPGHPGPAAHIVDRGAGPRPFAAYTATTTRILRQLRNDHRTIAMILVVPALLMALLYFIYQDVPATPQQVSLFDRVGISMLGILPFIVMFLITAIAMQRERSSGTLERLLTTPLSKLDLLGGYGTAFSVAAAAQAAVACLVSFGLLGLNAAGNPGWVVLIAMIDAVLGVALGLLCSAFARTEFQAVQFMPVVAAPQIFLCGLLVPREQLPGWLEAISNVLPLSYAVDALHEVSVHSQPTGLMWRDLAIVAGFAAVALCLGAATLRRRTV